MTQEEYEARMASFAPPEKSKFRTFTAFERALVWDLLWHHQEGTCAACIDPPKVIDHDHSTGLVRGLLCYSCNTLEGFCKNTFDRRFSPYRENPPARELGLEVTYRPKKEAV